MTVNKTLAIGCLAASAVGAIMSFSLVGTVLSFRNSCVRAEAGIRAQYDQNRNNYDNYFKRLQEVAQVPAMYADDMRKVWDSAIGGRYGKDGSKAMFQWIQEHNPTVDSSLYAKVQAVAESGRLSFENDQKSLIDRKREYEVLLNSNVGAVANVVLGYPKMDLSKFGIVTSDETEKAFETKRSEPLKLR